MGQKWNGPAAGACYGRAWVGIRIQASLTGRSAPRAVDPRQAAVAEINASSPGELNDDIPL
jgi:hypothetical protein